MPSPMVRANLTISERGTDHSESFSPSEFVLWRSRTNESAFSMKNGSFRWLKKSKWFWKSILSSTNSIGHHTRWLAVSGLQYSVIRADFFPSGGQRSPAAIASQSLPGSIERGLRRSPAEIRQEPRARWLQESTGHPTGNTAVRLAMGSRMPSPKSYTRSGRRSGERANRLLEHPPPMLITLKLIKAGARRSQQHNIARHRALTRKPHRVFERLRVYDFGCPQNL